MTGWWERFREGAAGPGIGLLFAFVALLLSLALLAVVFRPIVQALSARDAERVRKSRVQRISFVLFLASLGVAILVFLTAVVPAGQRHERFLYEIVEFLTIVFAFYALVEIVITFFAFYLPQARGRAPAEPIYRDIFRTIVYFALFLFALKQAFPKAELGALLTTSAILSVVLGLALQESLSNIFAGITLSVDRPFKPGDWLLVDGQEGKVLDSNWRSTKLMNRDNDVLHVPNSIMARANFLNYAQPSGLHLCRRTLGIEHGAQPNRVRSILIDMMCRVSGVLRSPPPDVFTLEYGELATVYELRFWIENFDARTQIESDVMRGAWYHLKRNHIRIAAPVREVHVRRDRPEQAPEEILEIIRKVDILKPLAPEEQQLLAEDLRVQIFGRDEVVCRQGEMGSTFYIVKSGAISVRVRGAGGEETEVARLKPGQHFGEMSLLTGEPRNSTCVALDDLELLALDRESFGVLIGENPTIAKAMSEVLAQRAQEIDRRLAAERGTMRQEAPKTDDAATKRILEKIWSIFGFRS